MKLNRTKRLTINRVLQLLQLRYGTQVKQVIKDKELYTADSISCIKKVFTRSDILDIEDKMYSNFGC